jgi:hypothetical protein
VHGDHASCGLGPRRLRGADEAATGTDGAKQGLILLVATDNIHALLADLKARTGRPVEFEDRDPRK